jgi:hypothetical protein
MLITYLIEFAARLILGLMGNGDRLGVVEEIAVLVFRFCTDGWSLWLWMNSSVYFFTLNSVNI